MKYDFTSILDRHGRDAGAVDALGQWAIAPYPPKDGYDFIPMWVADMNFPTAPSIPQAIIDRAMHPAYGYFSPSDAYYQAIINWQTRHNQVKGLTPDHIGYENGVLGGVLSAIACHAEPGASILVHSPTYIGFTMTLIKNGYHIVHSPLKKDDQGIYRMDFADMEEKIRTNHIQVAIFCSPHNPCGRCWEDWELKKAAEVFEKNEVTIVCDEIWSDLVLDGYQHIPFQSVSEYARNHTAAFYAPSKTFNLAGLVGSYHIIYNPKMRDRIRFHSEKTHYNEMNVLSMHGLIGAYSPVGEEWLSELRQVITANVDYAAGYIREHFDGIEVSRPQATYMLFLDCKEWLARHDMDIRDLLHAGWDVGVGWQDGTAFGGPTHIRMNLALPLSRVEEAMKRLHKIFCK